MKTQTIILGIVVLSLFIFSSYSLDKKDTFAIVTDDTCFSDIDCKLDIEKGFCDVMYQCVNGRCAIRQIPCPPPDEICSSGFDEDEDGLVGCRDPDCFNTIYCPCSVASFTQCRQNGCFCPAPTNPRWIIFGDDHYCQCQ